MCSNRQYVRVTPYAHTSFWYRIEVQNPHHVNKGIQSLTVDGKAVASNLIPAFNDGETHLVDWVEKEIVRMATPATLLAET